MSKQRLKLALAVALLAIGLVGLGVGLGGLGRLVEFFGSGADPASALHDTLSHDPAAARLTWLPDRPQPARALEPAARLAVADGYLRAWDELTTGYGIDYLTGPAAAAPEAALAAVPTVDGPHRVELEFYSADGQVLVLTDSAQISRAASRGDGTLLVTAAVEEFRAILLLEDGNWRLRSLTRLDASPPAIRFIDDPRPDATVAVAGATLLLGLLAFVPGRKPVRNTRKTPTTDTQERN